MRSGICPKCGSHEIYAKKNAKIMRHNHIEFDAWHATIPDIYICGICGYLEKYITKGFDTLSKKWEKLSLDNEQ